MKHAHIITHSSTHAVCLLLFYQKMRSTALRCLLTRPDKRSRGIYCLLPLWWDCISQDSCISSYLPSMLPKFNYHLFVATVAHSLCCVRVCWWPCVRSHTFEFFISRDRTHIHKWQAQPKTSNSFISSSVSVAIACSCAILRRRKKTSAILAEQAVDDWSCDLGI